MRSMWRWLEASALILSAEDQTTHWTALVKPSMANNLVIVLLSDYCV